MSTAKASMQIGSYALVSGHSLFVVLHELWVYSEGQDFCLAGPHGDAQRALIPADARLVWTVEAKSYHEAMTLYWQQMGWGEWTTDFPEFDKRTYVEWGYE